MDGDPEAFRRLISKGDWLSPLQEEGRGGGGCPEAFPLKHFLKRLSGLFSKAIGSLPFKGRAGEGMGLETFPFLEFFRDTAAFVNCCEAFSRH